METDFVTIILTALAAAVPGLVTAGWALFVAYAAKTEATFDDWVVARVKDIARSILKDELPPSPPPAVA
jgi:hypothetical protein